MKPSELKVSVSIDSYNEKTAKNYRNWNVDENRIVSKLSKLSFLKIEDFNTNCVIIACPYLSYFPRNQPSKSVKFGSLFKTIQLILK